MRQLKTKGAVTLCNLVSNFQRNIEKCFCCSCRGGVLHRATQSEQLATICTEKALRYSLLARRSRWSVGFTKKSTHARGKLRCKLLEGCYTVQRQLQVATIVAKSRTGFYFVQRCAQQKKDTLQVAEVPVTLRNSSATCNATVLKIAQWNRALTILWKSKSMTQKHFPDVFGRIRLVAVFRGTSARSSGSAPSSVRLALADWRTQEVESGITDKVHLVGKASRVTEFTAVQRMRKGPTVHSWKGNTDRCEERLPYAI